MYKSISVVTCVCQGSRKQRRFGERTLRLFIYSYGELSSSFWCFFCDTVGIFVCYFILAKEN